MATAPRAAIVRARPAAPLAGRGPAPRPPLSRGRRPWPVAGVTGHCERVSADYGGSAFLAEGTQPRGRVGSRKPLSARSPGKGGGRPARGLLLNLEGRQTLPGKDLGAVFRRFLTARQAPGKGEARVCPSCPGTGAVRARVGDTSSSPALAPAWPTPAARGMYTAFPRSRGEHGIHPP